jgi:hypothetical protein
VEQTRVVMGMWGAPIVSWNPAVVLTKDLLLLLLNLGPKSLFFESRFEQVASLKGLTSSLVSFGGWRT